MPNLINRGKEKKYRGKYSRVCFKLDSIIKPYVSQWKCNMFSTSKLDNDVTNKKRPLYEPYKFVTVRFGEKRLSPFFHVVSQNVLYKDDIITWIWSSSRQTFIMSKSIQYDNITSAVDCHAAIEWLTWKLDSAFDHPCVLILKNSTKSVSSISFPLCPVNYFVGILRVFSIRACHILQILSDWSQTCLVSVPVVFLSVNVILQYFTMSAT